MCHKKSVNLFENGLMTIIILHDILCLNWENKIIIYPIGIIARSNMLLIKQQMCVELAVT